MVGWQWSLCYKLTPITEIQHNADIQESSKIVVVGVCWEVHPALREILLENTFGHITVKKKLKAFDTLHSKVGDRIRINVENMTLTTPFLGKNLNYISESESADHVTVSSIRDLRAITTMAKIVNILFSNPIQKRFCLSRFPTTHLEQLLF